MFKQGKYRNRHKSKDESAAKNSRILASRKKKRDEKEKKKGQTVESVTSKYDELVKLDTTKLTKFTDFPLSGRTLSGLEECEYEEPTEIQRDSLPFSLTGSDIVGAAKTGSGKTLALVIPVLECLWRNHWTLDDGTGAVIISPTRELALQTYTTLNNVGKHHTFSCALLIGGTDVSFERDRLGRINILVCTPGRLLQHMDENEQMNCDNLLMLVIDEADRILDMGFKSQLDAIVANLPPERQTLLFSATQTRNVKDLTRVCTKDPVFVSVHENASVATPDQLQQSYMVVEEEDKINTVWSFIVNHKRRKTLIFVSCCKQARFITDAFRHLRPGLSVLGLWGSMNQTKRVETFQTFEERDAAVMVATDVASRGLDFSDVDWVIQMDCPTTVDDYIHRVGRTARMKQKGQAVLCVTARQEPAMIAMLKQRNIPLAQITPDPSAVVRIQTKLQSVLAQFQEMNQFAQQAVVSYLRSVYFMPNKKVFDVTSIDATALAASYGLMAVPRIRFLNKKGISTKDKLDMKERMVKAAAEEEKNEEEENNEEVEEGVTDDSKKTKKRRDKKENSLIGRFELNDDEDELFKLTKKDVFKDADDQEPLPDVTKSLASGAKVLTKAKMVKKLMSSGVSVNTKKTFDDESDDEDVGDAEKTTENGKKKLKTKKVNEKASGSRLDIEEAKAELKATDKEDRKRWKERYERAKEQKILKKLKKKNKEDEEVDLADDASGGGSGIDSDADLGWLPDPDKVQKEYGIVYSDDGEEFDESAAVADLSADEPPPADELSDDDGATKRKNKRKRRAEIEDAEQLAIALLTSGGGGGGVKKSKKARK